MFPLTWWIKSNVINLSTSNWLISLGIVPHHGLKDCWQIRYSAGAIASQPWWVEIHGAAPTHNLHPCHLGYFVHELSRWWQEYVQRMSAQWAILTTWIQISSHTMPIQRSMSSNLFPDPLITNFPIMFFIRSWPSSQTISYSAWMGANQTFGNFSFQPRQVIQTESLT